MPSCPSMLSCPSVSTFAPTKRGLKEALLNVFPFDSSRFNLCPDEKGTESHIFMPLFRLIKSVFQPLPRRKGD